MFREISICDFLQVGPLIYTTLFLASKAKFKEYFHQRRASIQVAKEGEQSPITLWLMNYFMGMKVWQGDGEIFVSRGSMPMRY